MFIPKPRRPPVAAPLALAAVMSLMACQTETAAPGPAPEPLASAHSEAEYRAALLGLGIDTAGLQSMPGGYLAEGDIWFGNEDLNRILAEGRGLAKSAHRYYGHVDEKNARLIKVLIHSSLSAWQRDVTQALNLWNEIHSQVRFILVNSGADLTIAADTWTGLPAGQRNQPASTCGIGGFPTMGGPFQYIGLNIDNTTMASDQKERISVIMHEVGHTIGFIHTNTTNPNEGTAVSAYPNPDPGSIMNGSSCGTSDDNFSMNDRRALLFLYPTDMPIPGSTFDIDALDDRIVWRPGNGNWRWTKSTSAYNNVTMTKAWGQRGDIPLPKTRFDSDARHEMAVWRPDNGNWYVLTSSSNYVSALASTPNLGQRGDQPFPGLDVDADGKTDIAYYRWTDNSWKWRTSSSNWAQGGQTSFGLLGVVPVPFTDMDGDGKNDLVLYDPSDSRWYWRTAASGFASGSSVIFGQRGDVPVPGADLDNDSKDDRIVYRPLAGQWLVSKSSSNFAQSATYTFGTAQDFPVGEWDVEGDGKADLVGYGLNLNGSQVFASRTKNSFFTSGPTWFP